VTSLELYSNVMPGVRRAEDARPVAAAAPELREGARRILNVAVAAVGVVVATPLLVGIAVLVRLTSPGPILYRQVRIGVDRRGHEASGNHRRVVDHGGKPFTIYKFRTMAAAASRRTEQVWAAPNDARVTPLGRVLRKYRLDELPQLFNVLRGDMNIVGPRPEQPNIFAQLRAQVPRYQERQRVRPGITGWAQINHHYDRCLNDVRTKVAYDLEYIARQSLLSDLSIMLRTAPVLIFKKGAW
jgi:lipopolysaccharide/colanic/teichoic acid biosynthesis glycosyltransferase